MKQVFTDVTPDKWYYKEIERGSFYGILQGFPDGTFRPDLTMTRAETGAVLVRSFERVVFYSIMLNGIVLTAVLLARRS